MARSEVLVDDERFRVTRWTIDPGDRIDPHVHELDYVVVPLRGATMHVVDADGSETKAVLRVGTSYARVAGAHHEVQNRGDVVVEFVEVEAKRG